MIRTKNKLWIAFAVAIIGSLLYFYLDPAASRFFPPCLFYTFTGLACPGCGSQRAFHALLHGDVLKAIDHNLLFVLFLPLMIFAALVAINNIFRKTKWRQDIFNSAAFTKLVLIAVIVFGVLRNIPVFPFNWLAPGAH